MPDLQRTAKGMHEQVSKESSILIVDDSKLSRSNLNDLLCGLPVYLHEAENGKEALDFLNSHHVDILITDLHMPVMDGVELIANLSEQISQPVILVQTVDTDIQTVIKVMRYGIFDYLIHPFEKEQIQQRIQAALAEVKIKKIKKRIKEEKRNNTEFHKSWNDWKEKVINRSSADISRSLFHNLKASLSQGRGPGLLTSVFSMIEASAEKSDSQVTIPIELFNMLKENVQATEKFIEKVTEAEALYKSNEQGEKVSLRKLIIELNQVIDRARSKTNIKGQRLIISDVKLPLKEHYTDIQLDSLKNSLYEILINAMKFAPRETFIYVIISYHRNRISFSVLNEPAAFQSDQNSFADMAHVITEPFQRLHLTTDERFQTLDFGLGLALAHAAITAQNGRLSIFTVKDNLDLTKELSLSSDSRELVCCEVELPVSE